jgi:hypothetical protein
MATIKSLTGAGWLKDADDNFAAVNAELAYSTGFHITPFVFDTAAKDATSPTPVSNKTVAAHPLAVTIPDNAIVIGGSIDVIAAVTSDGDATVAISLASANDLLTATAKATLAAKYQSVMATTTAPIKLEAAKAVTVTVGAAALTGGVINGYIIWIEGA